MVAYEIGEESLENPASGRNAGCTVRGRLAKGHPRSETDRPRSPSIPPRFQTVLKRAEKPPAAFLSGSTRQTYNQSDDLPGPGTYRARSAIETESTSYSHKGYGGLSSQTQRFPPRKMGARRKIPGPGAYSPPAFGQDSQRSSFLRAPTTAAFSKSERTTLGAGASGRGEMPGPGTYVAKSSISSDKATTKGFRDNIERFASPTKDCAPPPGTYDLDAATTAFAERRKARATAAFRASARSGNTARRTHAHAEDAAAAGLLQSERAPPPRPESVPDANNIGRRLPFGASHSFFAPSQHDRFGRAMSPPRLPPFEVPPPGHYHDGAIHPPVVTGGARSGFRSESPRTLAEGAMRVMLRQQSPPGPAFYTQQDVPSRKSFLAQSGGAFWAA